jgi:hypothetical protein
MGPAIGQKTHRISVERADFHNELSPLLFNSLHLFWLS